jgi:hypothetical protein
MIVRTPRHHTSAAIGGMPAESCLLAAASDLWSSTAKLWRFEVDTNNQSLK